MQNNFKWGAILPDTGGYKKHVQARTGTQITQI
jgi:hypothetical protein